MAYGQYTEDKPKDCRYCYFWGPKEKGMYARFLLLSAETGECKQ